MFNEYKDKIKQIKEDLIYAVDERYDGELQIEDAAKDAYTKMVLESDLEVYKESNLIFANTVSRVIDMLEIYIKDFEKFNGRTLFRNSAIVKDTLDDLIRTAQILTLSIRKNNADWQVKLDELVNTHKPSVKERFNKIALELYEELGKLEGEE